MAGICPDCITGDKLAGTPKGIMVNSLALPGYFSSASGSYDPPQYTKKALVISPDVFGFGLDNPKLLADIFAEKCGVDVWAVDTFKGKHISSRSIISIDGDM
jgi:carboxymethylenebutenolidase